VKDDFFTRLGNELDQAAERQARRRLLPRLHWTRRTGLVLVPAMVLIAVPAFAAVTGVLRSSSRKPVNVNTLCATGSAPPPRHHHRPVCCASWGFCAGRGRRATNTRRRSTCCPE
jgi:hypothetical protein